MRICIYCRKEKSEDLFSLEHVIPKFLGGKFVPDKFKTRNVCKECNNNLGLFVDASFEKDWLFHNTLNQEFYDFFDPKNVVGLPLNYMGIDELVPPNIANENVCELWIGPLGEQVYLIRPEDNRLYWYLGGNPRTLKTQESVAYFLFSERSKKNLLLSIRSFQSAFEGKKVKKILCTKTTGIELSKIGFSEPNEIDENRIKFFMKNSNVERTVKYSKYINSDMRFIIKLAIGMTYCLFPNTNFSTKYLDEMYRGLWFNHIIPSSPLKLNGSIYENDNLKEILGVKSGITISFMCSDHSIVMSLNIAKKFHWTIKCAEFESLAPEDEDIFNHEGRVFIIYRAVSKYIEMSLSEFVAHKTGCLPNAELKEVEDILKDRDTYFRNL